MLIYFCDSCMTKLVKWGEPAVIAFEMICENYIRNGKNYMIVSSDVHFSQEALIQMIKFLEKKQFVVSTECEDAFIKVKPLGNYTYNDVDLFCPCHCRDWSNKEEWEELLYE